MNDNSNQSTEKKNSFGDYFKLGEVAGYFFRKKDPNRPANFNIRAMHSINRISMLIFLAAIIFFIFKKVFMN